MDKINKFLLKLSKKERSAILKILADIQNLKLNNYDIKPLEGFKNYYRLRKGKIRIVYTKQDNKSYLINISYRKDIYKDY
jgi:mRNA-degrading endonuclease RelE of RelBE toxin-antitoxin system